MSHPFEETAIVDEALEAWRLSVAKTQLFKSRENTVYRVIDQSGAQYALAKNIAAEFEGTGVCVIAFRPRPIDSDMQSGAREASMQRIGRDCKTLFVSPHERGRLRAPSNVARCFVHFLAKRNSGMIYNLDAFPEMSTLVDPTTSSAHD